MAQQTLSTEIVLTPAKAKRLLTAYIENRVQCMVLGSPGIGKSQIIAQIGKELGKDVYDNRLLLFTETDIRGIPFYSAATGKMEWAPPGSFPLDANANAILFLDEITQASPSVQAAALQLVLDRKIGDLVLPEGVSIVAAGNRLSDKTGAKPLIKALANRFTFINMTSSFDDWQSWAIANNVHPDVVGFLSQHKGYLDQYEHYLNQPGNSFPTPRSWVLFVSDLLNKGYVPEDLELAAIAGAIGSSVANEFHLIRGVLRHLPDPDDILSGKVTELKGVEPKNRMAVEFSIATGCSYRIRELLLALPTGKKGKEYEDWCQKTDNFVKFSMNNLEKEVCMMMIISAIRLHEIQLNPILMPNFAVWLKENKKHFDIASSVNV